MTKHKVYIERRPPKESGLYDDDCCYSVRFNVIPVQNLGDKVAASVSLGFRPPIVLHIQKS